MKPNESTPPSADPAGASLGALPVHERHARSFEAQRFVYPVLSRRSGGVSIGVNLNPDKVCNFDCIYCQVDRRSEAETRFVEIDALLAELAATLDAVADGSLFAHERFRDAPAELLRLNDVAFSGDGEPTTHRNFDEVVARCAELKRRRGLDDVKFVLITNASMFHRPHVQRGLTLLDANQGEIWAKLDAGTPEYYERIERTKIPFQRVLDNIASAARVRPLVIQSLFLRVAGEPPDADEIAAYCDRLNEISRAGGELRLVQVYTIARRTAVDYVSPLLDEEVDEIADQVRSKCGLPAAAYYGRSPT